MCLGYYLGREQIASAATPGRVLFNGGERVGLALPDEVGRVALQKLPAQPGKGWVRWGGRGDHQAYRESVLNP